MSPIGRLSRAAAILGMTASMVMTAGCASDAAPAVDASAYRAELAAICVASNAERSAIADPLDQAGVASFARSVADVLTRQAEAARALRSLDDLTELVDAPPETVKTPIDRLAEAFPGSELVTETY
ncbi:hypothetical protein OAV42_02990 [Ilumatobacter sp.]|nr:hypothetical protein [Ilumatobacter sp.]